MSKEVIIIGGGVIGLCSAYYLQKAGHQVAVIDNGNGRHGASHGNCGMIALSHLSPIASPGMVSKGLRWMLSPKSPFYIRPRLSSELISWGRKFYRSSTQAHVDSSLQPFGDYLQLSKKLFQELSTTSDGYFFQESGLLVAYQTDKSEAAEIKEAEVGQQFGLDVRVLSQEQIAEIEQAAHLKAKGAIYYGGDMHLHPGKFIQYLKSHLEDQGVLFHWNATVKEFQREGGQIQSVRTNFGNISADEFVLTAGAWSGQLAKSLNLSLPMMPAKGYSFDLPSGSHHPSIPTILSEGKVAITPMGKSIRFGGTLEITKLGDQQVRMKRIDGMLQTVRRFYPDLSIQQPSPDEIWSGYRPCSPDGLPYLGRDQHSQNLIVATGHAMLGLTLGPATGKVVQELVQKEQTSIEIDFLHPNRKI